MKVALVTNFPAFPPTAGNRSRIQQLACAVKQLGHELTFVLLPNGDEVADDAAHEDAFDRYVKVTGRHEGRNWPGKWTLQQIGRGLGLVGDWMGRTPSGEFVRRQIVSGKFRLLRRLGLEGTYRSALDNQHDAGWARQLAAIGSNVDAVIVEYVFNSWAFACFPQASLRLLDTHDAFANRHRSYLVRGVSNYWLSLTAQDENAGFRRADAVLAIQEEEARHFRSQLAAEEGTCNPPVAVVSHFMRQGDGPIHCETEHAAVFLASDNPANRHGLDSFLQNVLPLVLREIPGFQLKLAGSICSHVPDRANVTKLGWVQDLHAVFSQAPLSINPLLVGTGINIKLLEAMAAGVPTVSTETGVRGLPATYRNGVVAVPDHDPAAFAAEIVRLATDADLRGRIARAAFDDAKRWNAEQMAALDRCLSHRKAGTGRGAE